MTSYVVTRVVNRAVRLAHQLVGFGVDTPPEALVWAELSPDRALHRITHQTEADFTVAAPGPPSAR
ncbi:hypothetical protein Dvina_25065 [Dactylosporangium vinaceum]|uniref:Uncharacterized protein n=1 Tax=Dactylosporangium vinaceum TaxID=53362 RepID=A0ABV5MDX0_9ACTN|nr:hypothetical protein [Dactylosporangium vinaceum]UAC01034.1 hypothetical protein Dvina_25065 [Dactylosporangium vinaceum]